MVIREGVKQSANWQGRLFFTWLHSEFDIDNLLTYSKFLIIKQIAYNHRKSFFVRFSVF